MSLADEILTILPTVENAAISAKELFERCKGAEDVKAVSTALSNLFAARIISRKEGKFGSARFSYWNAAPEKVHPRIAQKKRLEEAAQEYVIKAEAILKPTLSEFVAASLEGGFQTEPETAAPVKPMMPEISTEQLQTPKPESYTAADDKLLEELFKQNPLDTQIGGDHYQKLGLYQPWKVLKAWLTPEELKGAMKKEVIWYLAREQDKGGREDIKKALHTLQIYVHLTEGEVAA